MKQANRTSAGDIRIGVGGWTYEPWRGHFYPAGLSQKRELEYASRQLTSIEINGTFYGTQKPDTFVKWHDETPDDFVFAVKAPRFATHRRALGDAGESIERFFSSGIMQLKKKLGPINWQLPPTKKFDAGECEAFFKLLPSRIDGQPIRHAIEVRHPTFCHAEFIALAREYGMAIVVAGDSKYPQVANLTAPYVYARIMGTVESEPNGYAESELDAWAARIKGWASGEAPDGLATVAEPKKKAGGAKASARDVYLYVISGYKTHNPAASVALIERIRESGASGGA
jgi:uncharacterized protein YecE (DUF72 family)